MPDEQVDSQPIEEGQSTPQSSPQVSEVLNNPTLSRFHGEDGKVSIEKLADSYINLEKSYSQRVPVPNKDSSQEDWDKFHNRFRPEKKEDYKLVMPGIDNIKPEDATEWKNTFWDAGLPQEAVDKIMNRFTQDIVSGERLQNQEALKAKTETTLALQQEWGANYEANRGMITSMLRELGGDDLVGALDTEVDHNKPVADFMYNVAKVMRSSEYISGDGSGNFGLMSIAEAEAEKSAIMNDPNHSLYKSYHDPINKKNREAAMKRLLELNTVISKG